VSYKDFRIWEEARELTREIHELTVSSLPRFEMYEEGRQIRRSIKSVRSNIVEAYGRRRYRRDYVRFLVLSHASCEETKDHLETLFETGSVEDESLYIKLHDDLERLGRGLYRFIEAVQKRHDSRNN